MTDLIHASKLHISADITGLPHPEPFRTSSVSDTEVAVALPRPASLSSVADSGRISFGAGFRLRAGN